MKNKSLFRLIPLALCLTFLMTGMVEKVVARTTVQPVDRFGKKILLDGFLMEWEAVHAKPIASTDSLWMWDAMLTTEGVAGYFRLKTVPSCSTWSIGLQPAGTVPLITIVPTVHRNSHYYQIDYHGSEEPGWGVIEWLLPWGIFAPDSSGETAVTIDLSRSCTELSDSLVLTFRTHTRRKTKGLATVIARIVMIGLLAGLYVMVNSKIRRQIRQKEALRQ